MSTYLPEDAVVEILARLPVKPLLRFRCVSKTWCSLIDNPNFISKHFDLFNNNGNDARLLVTRQPRKKGEQVISLLSYRNENDLLDDAVVVSSIEMLALPFDEPQHEFLQPLGPCNGIYCLSAIPIILFNPATREFKAIPESHIPCPPGTEILSRTPGFGFDSKSNDYKLVRFLWLWEQESHTEVTAPLVEVYTLSSDSWRKLESVPSCNFVRSRGSTYLKGVCYWWAYDANSSDPEILSFDLSSEVFQVKPLPTSFPKQETFGTLGLLDESLALVLYDMRETDIWFEIWKMDQGSTWSKQFTVEPLAGVLSPVGFGKNGVLVLESNDGQLVLYDPHSQVTRKLKVHGSQYSFRVVIYKESLVSISRRNVLGQQDSYFHVVPEAFFADKSCWEDYETDF